jgi:YD repeat-containing protein
MKTLFSIQRLTRLWAGVLWLNLPLAVLSAPLVFTHGDAGRLVGVDYGAGKTDNYAYDNAGNLVQRSAPASGIIAMPLPDSEISLSWPVATAGYLLQSATTLGPGAQWTDLNLTPTQVGNLNVVTLTLSETRFYRLRKT